jgi:hypothetical protein
MGIQYKKIIIIVCSLASVLAYFFAPATYILQNNFAVTNTISNDYTGIVPIVLILTILVFISVKVFKTLSYNYWFICFVAGYLIINFIYRIININNIFSQNSDANSLAVTMQASSGASWGLYLSLALSTFILLVSASLIKPKYQVYSPKSLFF